MNSEPKEMVRSGFTVSAEMQKIWAVELDLFEKLKAVLQKHSIPYYASGGTLLGAVRHSGFIPWDDDIDIMMLRSDYDRLLEVAPSEFEYPYFFQTHYTDKNYYRGHAQLRNSNTTATLPCESLRVDFNQGIFIDIFPVDYIPDNPRLAEKQRKQLHRINRLLNNGARFPENAAPTVFNKAKRAAVSIISIFYSHKRQYRKMEAICKKYNLQKSQRIGFLSFDPNDERLKYPASIFNNSVDFAFENTTICGPEGYRQMLTEQYGDYMIMQKDPSYHGKIIFDTQTPYKEFISALKAQQQEK